MLEICVDSLASAKRAIVAGAHQIEVCSDLQSGGFTPDVGLVLRIMDLVHEQPVHKWCTLNAIIRCRGHDPNDFTYSDNELLAMICDMKILQKFCNGFVFGALTKDKEVDVKKCYRFVSAAGKNKVSFSPAFDHTADFKKAAGIICKLGFYRLLTSGHRRGNETKKSAEENISYLYSKEYAYGPEQNIITPGGEVISRNIRAYINGTSKWFFKCKCCVTENQKSSSPKFWIG